MPDLANCADEMPITRQKGRIMRYTVAMTEDEALRESGRRIAQIRLSRNLTQAELAQRGLPSVTWLSDFIVRNDNLKQKRLR